VERDLNRAGLAGSPLKPPDIAGNGLTILPPDSAVANFHNTADWMKMQISGD
jgi:hypothetical protein